MDKDKIKIEVMKLCHVNDSDYSSIQGMSTVIDNLVQIIYEIRLKDYAEADDKKVNSFFTTTIN